MYRFATGYVHGRHNGPRGTSLQLIIYDSLYHPIRFMVAAEYEAIQLYMQLAESTDNKLAVEVLKDIADEERVHPGDFLTG